MSRSNAIARVLDGGRLECVIVSPLGATLTLVGRTTDLKPEIVDGASVLGNNVALVDNAWAFAKFTFLTVSLPTREEQANAAKRAKAHSTVAEWIAELSDDLVDEWMRGWCSSCFAETDHQRSMRPTGQLAASLCAGCGSPTVRCAGPGCENMAVRGQGGVRLPSFCAEHRHEITGFAKADRTLRELSDYRAFLEYDKPNLGRTTKLVGVGLAGVALAGPAAFAVAPAIGGAVGTLVGGYSGAAASSYGLALLGGGSLAAGGLGMAGGAMVVGALGGTLGGVLGASVTNAYVREDKSFRIEMLRGGVGTPVIVCNGFLSESGTGWGEWRRIITTRYPDSPVYRVHWGAKELKDLAAVGGGGALKMLGGTAIKRHAAKATRLGATRLGPIGPALLAAQVAKNPWHLARNRANKTGVIVADLLARTEADAYVLVGHSLGARAMVVAAQAIGTKSTGPRIESVHLLGAAIGAESDWHDLTARVDDAVYNYHSTNDKILKFLYAAAEAGGSAAGLRGFVPATEKLRNIDVSASVAGHSDYHHTVTLL